jgi:regulatory protein SWI6
MAAKQAVIDSIHAQLRESSAQLGEERRRLERLQARAKERRERKQKIANLRRAHEEEQYRLNQMQAQSGMSNGDSGSMNMRLGDADKPFLPVPASNPSTSILRACLNAYVSNNSVLESEVRNLKGKSRELEGKYRRVISLCTKVEESRIDGVLGSLWRAVSSEGEGDVELGRVREFLMKVEGCE